MSIRPHSQLRPALDVSLDETPPDHSTVSRTRRRIDVETHLGVFTWALERLADAGLVRGQTVGIDATTLEANAALRSIVRRDTGVGYARFLRNWRRRAASRSWSATSATIGTRRWCRVREVRKPTRRQIKAR